MRYEIKTGMRTDMVKSVEREGDGKREYVGKLHMSPPIP
jgi:hypothetical protein